MSHTAEERAAQFRALINLLHSVTPEVYNAFDITRTHYESAGTKIEVDILAPKRLKLERTKSHPVIVRIHGGFLVAGSSLFPAWFSKWILDFAEQHDAVIVSPNYRLLPEVKGRDIMHDMANFWTWLQSDGPDCHLSSVGWSYVELNLSQILLVGESAGGYLALQSVLSGFIRPKAMVTLYPMIDMQAPHYTKPYPKPVVGVTNFPNEAVDSFLSATLGKPAITEAHPPSRLDSAIAIVQNGRFLEVFGHEQELFVLERIENELLPPKEAGQTLLPPLFLLHGEDDTAVPAEGTRKLVNLLKRKHPDTKLHVSIRPGDHGFDFTASTQDRWLREGLNFVIDPWLGGKSRM
ncbi:Alpha/Beta hydrolase protein [Dactylonectria macrodidyma]|uniref:Alpha/Beta hydrolase protein n=1 Tax=Dactylonectria macrodidyma TaxID=307937 RepID=A0A9P9DLP5_9HYPO|nr:Alpha/Beta hydrolase protein [Dactylonectria macrodidyma]